MAEYSFEEMADMHLMFDVANYNLLCQKEILKILCVCLSEGTFAVHANLSNG